MYRVALDGQRRSVVVKRCSASCGDTERLLYENVLAELSVPTLRCYGSWEEGTSTWFVLEDAGDDEPTFADQASRAALTAWVVGLHLEGRALRVGVALPDRGSDHFAGRLSAGRKQLLERLERDDLGGEDRSVIERAMTRCDLLAARWPEIASTCRRFPETLVHGDLVGENLRVIGSGEARTVVPLDWEKAGRGCGALDLALADEDGYFTATRGWLGASREEFAEVSAVGRIFRLLVHAWTAKPVEKVARYERRLARVMEEAGWSSRL